MDILPDGDILSLHSLFTFSLAVLISFKKAAASISSPQNISFSQIYII